MPKMMKLTKPRLKLTRKLRVKPLPPLKMLRIKLRMQRLNSRKKLLPAKPPLLRSNKLLRMELRPLLQLPHLLKRRITMRAMLI